MNNQLIETALGWRYAVKKFDSQKKISETDWKTLTQSLLQAPSSYGLQPWKFLVIQNPEIRAQLKPVSWNQSQVTDASHYVVFTSLEKITEKDVQSYINRIQELRGVSQESLKGYNDMMVTNTVKNLSAEKTLPWTQRQAYIAMGFLLEAAALLKIDATPMEGLDPAAYDKILKLEGTGWRSIAAVALGYRHTEDGLQHQKKVRFQESQVIKYI